MAKPLHPALRPYSPGSLVVIKWMTKDGERRSTHAKVHKRVALEDGDQAVLIYNLDRRDENGKPAKSMIRASAIQRRLDADAAEAAPPQAEPATEKQVAYAADLLERLGPIGWHNSDRGQTHPRPDMNDLRAMSKQEISTLIAELRYELGYDY